MAQAAPPQESGLLPPPPMLPQQQPTQPPLNIPQMLPMPQSNVPLPAPLPLPANTQSQAPFSQAQTINQPQFSQAQMNSYANNQISVPQQSAQLPPPPSLIMPAPAPQPYFTQYQTSFSQFPQIIPQTGLPNNFNMGLQQNMHGAGQNALAMALQNIATTQMIGNLGNILKGKESYKSAPSERRRRRSPSPKRRHRSRSDSPRNRNRASGKRRRNRSPQHKRPSPAKQASPAPQAVPAVESEPETTNLYKPPTPPTTTSASNPEKTPEYKSESTPTTPDYSARSPTPEYNASDTLFKDPDNKMSCSVANILTLAKNVATVKPSNRASPVDTVEPRIVSGLKASVSTSDSPAPNIKVKSLTDILREQALQSMMKKKEKASSPAPDSQEEEEDRRSRSPRNERSTTDSQTLSNPFEKVDQSNFVSESSDSELDSPGTKGGDSSWWATTTDKYSSVVSRQSDSEENELLEEPQVTVTRSFSPGKKIKKLEKRKLKEEKRRIKEAKRILKRQKAAKKAAKLEAAKLEAASESEDGILDSDQDEQVVLEEGEIIDQTVKMKRLSPIRAIPVNPRNWQRNLIAEVVERPRSASISRIKFPSAEGGGLSNGVSPRISPSVTPERDEAVNLSTPEKDDTAVTSGDYGDLLTDTQKKLARSPPKSSKVRVIAKRPRIVRTSKVSTTTKDVIKSTPAPKITPITFNDVPSGTCTSNSGTSNSGTSNIVTSNSGTSNGTVTSSNVVTSTVKPKAVNPFAKATPGEVSSTNHGTVSSTQPENTRTSAPQKKSPVRASSTNHRPSTTSSPLRASSSAPNLPTKASSKRVVLKARNVRTVKPIKATTIKPTKAADKPAPVKKSSYLDDFEAELAMLNAALNEPSTKAKEKKPAPALDVDNEEDLFDDIDSLLGLN